MNNLKTKLITISMASLVLFVGTFIMSSAAPQIEQSITDFRPTVLTDITSAVLILFIVVFIGVIFNYLRCSGEVV